MTTVRNKYIWITHPLHEVLLKNDVFIESWKYTNCVNGIHVFDEVYSDESHYLHCDICGLEVHIDKVVIPDGDAKEI